MTEKRNRLPALPSQRLPLAVAMRFAGKSSTERPAGLLTSEPEPAYFKLRLVRHGPWTPAVIWRPCPLILPDLFDETAPGPEDWCIPTQRPRTLRARIGDKEVSPDAVWGRGPRIDAAEYQWRLALRDWAVIYDPSQPEARDREPVELAKLPSLF